MVKNFGLEDIVIEGAKKRYFRVAEYNRDNWANMILGMLKNKDLLINGIMTWAQDSSHTRSFYLKMTFIEAVLSAVLMQDAEFLTQAFRFDVLPRIRCLNAAEEADKKTIMYNYTSDNLTKILTLLKTTHDIDVIYDFIVDSAY